MDFYIFLFGIVVILILTVLGLFERKTEWAVFPGMATVIGTLLTLSLWSDGSLTQVSGTNQVAVASASLASTSVWQFVSLVPLVFTLSAFLIAVYKVGSAF